MNFRITLLSRSLEYGGAERQLVELARGLKRNGHDVSVIVFYSHGPLIIPLTEAGVSLCSLNKKGRWDVLPFFFRLVRALRKQRPDYLYAFLGVPCIISALVKKFLPGLKIIWGVRASNIDLGRYDWLSSYSYRLECLLSGLADLIIANSHAGKEYAIVNGFTDKKMVVVPNGIDTDKFRPNRTSGECLRVEWGIGPHEKLVGIVARLDPMKDHQTFIKAAALLAAKRDDVRFVCVGDGPEAYKSELHQLAATAGLGNRIVWTGALHDMPAVYNALDITVSSSYGEGFPNVIGEAMACGVPCVVTDVGDSSWIVGDDGLVVSPQNPNQLSVGIERMLHILAVKGESVKVSTRNRICHNFGVENMIIQTVAALYDIV